MGEMLKVNFNERRSKKDSRQSARDARATWVSNII